MKVTAMETQTENGLKEVFSFLEAGNPSRAKKMLETLLENDLESEEIVFTISCCNFWIDFTRRLSEMEDPFERGETLLAEWKQFQPWANRQANLYTPALYAVRRGIFSLALQEYMRLMDERDPVQKAEICRKAGLCYKKLGEFENAKHLLSEANSLQGNQAAVLADLADCYALCGDDKSAKVLFREAFFIDAQRVDLDFLDSELIRCLIAKTGEKGYSGAVLQEWIPVYGVLWGVFNIKRELRPQEVVKLKQEIYALENELKDPACDSALLTPRLINMYFWLIDHYVRTDGNGKTVSEVLLKIKILDAAIYSLYVR